MRWITKTSKTAILVLAFIIGFVILSVSPAISTSSHLKQVLSKNPASETGTANQEVPVKQQSPEVARGEYRTERAVDANGYEYEYVTNDPFGMRLYILQNGLKVYLRVNTERPRIQTYIVVKTGSVNDPPDSTGISHIIEHMMFKGTSKIGAMDWEKEKVLLDEIAGLYEQYRMEGDQKKKQEIYSRIDVVSGDAAHYAIANEYDKLAEAIGAEDINAYTDYEETVYESNIPSNEIKRWVELERERFGGLVLRLFHSEMDSIYEEFNMYQEDDYYKVDEALSAGLYIKHPYGTKSIIGKAEHLKNPSLYEIYDYWKKWYVPNKMAICMSGDLDFEETIKAIDTFWGDLHINEVSTRESPVEEPITSPRIKDVTGPNAEFVALSFRFDGYTSADRKYVLLIDYLLNNYQAGLIDLDLVLEQKVLDAGSYSYFLRDYGAHYFYGYPRRGQKLEEVKNLILNELEKIKKGEFEDWLLAAILTNFRLARIQSQEGNGIAGVFITSFVNDSPWEDYVTFLDDLEKITKKDLVEFANTHYGNNYVVAYKRTGKDKNVEKIEKLPITSVEVNRDKKSAFFIEFETQRPKPITPVFIDYNKEIQTSRLNFGIEFDYIQNKTNELFSLNYIIEMGKNHIKELPLAVSYLPYLGTDTYSPAELQQEFYKLGLSFDVYSGDDRCYVSIYGLEESAEKGIALLEHILSNVKPDKTAYKKYIKGILKERQDSKHDKYTILWGALYSYGMYGKHSSFTDVISRKQLRRIKPEDLTDLVNDLYSYRHKIFYYGQNDVKTAAAFVEKYHAAPTKLKPYPQETIYTELPTEQNRVYYVNYDMTQADVVLLSKDVRFNKDLLPYIRVFNEYYGGSMASIVYQEIRESKGLSYSAYGGFDVPYKADESHYVFGYVGTQPDKLEDAVGTMLELFGAMPLAKVQFELSREAVLRQIETERIIKADIFWTYQDLLRKNIDYDYRRDVYEAVKTMDMEEVRSFFDSHVKNKKYTFLVIGKKKDIDMNVLEKLGAVRQLKLKEIFNY